MSAILFGSIISACSPIITTKPNAQFTGPYPTKFNMLAVSNPLLAKEIGKLPELQDGISESDVQALERLCALYSKDPESFDSTFREMYQIGKPEVRKYCSPLQALYWLCMDGEDGAVQNILKEYDLEKFMDTAWYSPEQNYKKKGKWLQSEARKLYDSCTDKEIKEQIDIYSRENPKFGHGLAVQYVFENFRLNPDKFDYRFDEKKFDKTQDENKKRWSDFNISIDRLNSPELIDYWTRKNIKWIYYLGRSQSNKQVFAKKESNCADTSELVYDLLYRSGYFSGPIYVESGSALTHVIAWYKDGDEYFIIDNGLRWSAGLRGPYKNLREIPYRIINYKNP